MAKLKPRELSETCWSKLGDRRLLDGGVGVQPPLLPRTSARHLQKECENPRKEEDEEEISRVFICTRAPTSVWIWASDRGSSSKSERKDIRYLFITGCSPEYEVVGGKNEGQRACSQ